METVSFILSIGSAILALASAAFSVFSYYRNVIHDRKRDTLDAYNTLQEQALDHLNDYTGTEIKRIIEEKDKDEYRELSRCLARIEHFSVGVNTGIYDKTTVYEMAHGYLDVAIWHKLQPVLEQKHKGKQEEYYHNYRKLVSWMQQQKGTK